MRDKAQIDLETIFEKRYILKEDVSGAAVASRLASKPVQQVIDVIVRMVDLGVDVPTNLVDRIVDEEKVGALISALESQHLEVPQAIAHALSFSGSDLDMGEPESDEVAVKPDVERHEELKFGKPRFDEIPDEEEEDSDPASIRLDPSMR